jgi:OmpA-OmpF porin, OOP family
MRRRYGIGALALTLMTHATATEAQAQATLSPSQARLTNATIGRDFATLDAWRRRIEAMPVDSLPNLRYQREKARHWLAFAESEYADNERGPVVESAFQRAVSLVNAVARRQLDDADELPLPGRPPVRSDLWEQWRAHRERGAIVCAPEAMAEFAVRLTTASHAPDAVSRRRAAADVRRVAALDSLVRVSNCAPPVTLVAVADPVISRDVESRPVDTVPAGVAAARVALRLPTTVHFAFGRSSLTGATRALLDRVVRGVADVTVTRVVVLGHTDRHGGQRPNARLSWHRARAVRRYLVARGLAVAVPIEALGVGSRQLLTSGRSRLDDATNRRAELRIELSDGTTILPLADESDLQPVRR